MLTTVMRNLKECVLTLSVSKENRSLRVTDKLYINDTIFKPSRGGVVSNSKE